MDLRLKEYELELKAVNCKISELQQWLVANFKSDFFIKICADKRILEADRFRLEFVINNIKNKRPSHGDAMSFISENPIN